MALSVGDIVDGVVTNLVKFGAFVDLDEGKSGLVHISEISDSYVRNVSDFLEKGQKVKVKILSMDPGGKIALTMKGLQEDSKESEPKTDNQEEYFNRNSEVNKNFEDKLNRFLKDSNEKIEQARSREKQKQSRTRSRNRF
ncbi:MAG: S1 RNA-binding domain-containing protein [Tissierellia bacterium]|nr:S1 RNA-binding domain-containing protein [Tissierellia bacterium]